MMLQNICWNLAAKVLGELGMEVECMEGSLHHGLEKGSKYIIDSKVYNTVGVKGIPYQLFATSFRKFDK